MMEEDHHDELRFVCKYCDKKYPSGKSLGGHMRSHVIAAAAIAANSSESDEKFANFSTLMINGNNGNGNGSNDPSGNGNSSSYGLRENPKKTWRAVIGGGVSGGSSSTFPFPNEKICKQCGKGFQSLKALCGHMACHSEKDRGMKDYDHSWTSENLDLDDDDDDDNDNDNDNKVVITDSQSDTDEPELQDPTRITRSKSKRYKKLIVKPYSFSLTNNSNNSNYNYGSSSVSEIDEIELEEVAMCLMMLSKDSANWAGFDFVVESSDNNSAVLETKSPSIDVKISKKPISSTVLDSESFQFENSNSGYSRNGIKKVESDIPVEELLRNGGDRNKIKSIWGRELSYEEKLEIRRNLFREFGYRDSLKKRIRDDDDIYNPELDNKEATNKKKNKYECLTCNKIFSSFQGLGGHRPCHKKNNLFASSSKQHENGENNLEREYGNSSRNPKYEKKIRVKKSKGHECPTCFRMFKSGQALGGHRRSHFINGSISHIAATENEGPSCSDMIDLNLPAPEED